MSGAGGYAAVGTTVTNRNASTSATETSTAITTGTITTTAATAPAPRPTAPSTLVEFTAAASSLEHGAHETRLIDLAGPLFLSNVRLVSPRLAFAQLASSSDDAPLAVIMKDRDGYLAPAAIAALHALVADTAEYGSPLTVSCASGFPELEPNRDGGASKVILHLAYVRIGGGVEFGSRQYIAPKAGRIPTPHNKKAGTGKWKRQSNANRAPVFVGWLVDTFRDLSWRAEPASRPAILDIAGGSGHVAFELACRRRCPTTIVDPRRAKPSGKHMKYFRRAAADAKQGRGALFRFRPVAEAPPLPPPPAADAEAEAEAESTPPGAEPAPLAAAFLREAERAGARGDDLPPGASPAPLPRQLTQRFDAAFVRAGTRTAALWDAAALVVGMHPDEATDAIVDLCVQTGKPFAIVPCCVFPESHPHRRTTEGGTVRTYEDYIEHLAAKHPTIERAELPIVGRSTVLFWRGESCGEEEEGGGVAV